MAVLGSSMIVTVIGLTAVMVARVHHRTSESSGILTEARFCAQSAVEVVVGSTTIVSDWRTGLGIESGDTYGPMSFGPGQISYKLVDEVDGDLANDPDHGVRITGTGVVGGATFRYSAYAEPPAYPCLFKAANAVETFYVYGGATFTVDGAPAYCHRGGSLNMGLFYNSAGATVNGDVEAAAVLNDGTINGTETENAPALTFPPSSTIDYYRDPNRATTIAWDAINDGNIKNTILSHAVNPYGSENPDGLYYIDVGDNSLTIKNCRIEGTLVISIASGQSLEIRKGIHWQPHRSDYPALIVLGGNQITIGIEYPLNEPDVEVNFNPTGMPYEGQTDSDQNDAYPGLIKGLIHIAGGELLLENSTEIKGAVIAADRVGVKNNVTITYDRNLVLNPPKRYRASHLTLVEGTWRRELNP